MTKLDDTIQFKIDPQVKIDFQQAVEDDGETVSVVLRRFVRDYLRNRVFSLTTVPSSGHTPEEVAA
jgi:hypothetical protein